MAFLAFMRKVISELRTHLHKILQLNWAKKKKGKKSETSSEMLPSMPRAETVLSAQELSQLAAVTGESSSHISAI